MEDLIDNVYKMIMIHEENNYFSKAPEIVLLCTPKYFHETIRAEERDRIRYLGNDIRNNFIMLEIIGIKVPLIIETLPINIQYTLMFREDYERLEKEKMYKRFLDMWESDK